MNKLRRRLLFGGAAVGSGAYIYHRGLRYPRMGFSPPPLNPSRSTNSYEANTTECIFLEDPLGEQDSTQQIDLVLRSTSPESTLNLVCYADTISLQVNNISTTATTVITGIPASNVIETVSGITRTITLNRVTGLKVRLNWQAEQLERSTYAVIGDTGGGDELGWCLSRASQLQADFLIHLGDLNYSEGEYQNAIRQLHESPLPVYVSIGNHDFNDSGLVYKHFRTKIGPLNSAFSVAGSQLVLLDTAASFLPANSGNRATLIKALVENDKHFDDTVIFTHKPFFDVRGPSHDHDMSGIGEHQWVYKTMQSLKSETIVCGHVHRSSIDNYQGVEQITAGEGLGFEDLRYRTHTAKILLAQTKRGAKTQFSWQNLNMPWLLHTSPTHTQKLKRPGLEKQLKWYIELQNSNS